VARERERRLHWERFGVEEWNFTKLKQRYNNFIALGCVF